MFFGWMLDAQRFYDAGLQIMPFGSTDMEESEGFALMRYGPVQRFAEMVGL